VCVALALKEHLEGDQRIDLQNPKAVDASIATLAGNNDLREAGLAK
jgi:hypothetical protein